MWSLFFVLLLAATATHYSYSPPTLLLDESLYTIYNVPYYPTYHVPQVAYTMEVPFHQAVPILNKAASIPLRPAVPVRPSQAFRSNNYFRPNIPYASRVGRQSASPSNWDLFIGVQDNPIAGMGRPSVGRHALDGAGPDGVVPGASDALAAG
eukprot:Protomagalhaensia_sp_Gyna_25__3613@NODE_3246_length_661_cov_6_745981_g2721_i0_p1_GENE_NODE_3246_length_661_cov_6_745981_g2721_i0NODE_3246_length_661_cov_6_745981_g2721_i0_p1_ORF_typecomplete_len152_score5_63_NODE_3246_length_661_cov_6_745981_g2721_i0113568